MSCKEESNVVRPLATFSKNIWRDHFSSVSSSDDYSVFDSLTKKIDPLKMKVKNMLIESTADSIENVKFIDTLCRLGVSHHFENDIEKQLEKIWKFQPNLVVGNDCDLNTTSIAFRLLRQYGLKIFGSIFNKFKNDDGKFKETLIDDARGMLSLYEAAHMRIQGENILEEALAFTKANLKDLAKTSSPHLAKLIMNSLDYPLNKSPPRLAARNYISFYEEENSKDESLLKFAKLDFNRLQLLHKQEINHIARFWKEYNFSSVLSYARERYVELYTWVNTFYFEPRYTRWRILVTKAFALISFIDDTFDAYGTPQELQYLKDALKRWDVNALDKLHDYTEVICKAVLVVFDEIDAEARKDGISYGVSFAKDALIGLVNNYSAEVKWTHDGYMPTTEEYLSVARRTSSFDAILTIALMGKGSIAGLEAFEWMQSEPRVMRCTNIIGRILNDITSYEFERLREHCPSSVECYMKQHNLSEENALVELEKQIEDAWKDINEECLKPTAMPRELLFLPLNIARASHFFYKHGDGYTHPYHVKDDIAALFFYPIPVEDG